MTLALDAFTKSALFQGSTSSTHTPTGTPRAVLILVAQDGDDTEESGTFTYGGVSVPRTPGISFAQDTATEFMASYAFFLGASIPTGAQTVAASGWGAADKVFWVITLTAAADTAVEDVERAQENQANPSVNLTTTVETWVANILMSGQGTQAAATAGSGYTKLDNNDFGQQVALVETINTPASAGTVASGWTVTSDDVAMIAVAIKEVSGTLVQQTLSTSGSGSPSLLKTPTKVLGASGTAARVLVRAPSRVLSASGVSIPKLLKTPIRTFTTLVGTAVLVY